MDWIAQGLAIGSIADTTNRDGLEAAGIQAILQLCGSEPEPARPASVKAVLCLDVDDGEPIPSHLLRRGVDFIRSQRLQSRQVLIACGAGMSRSPTFVAAYLHEEGMGLLDAFTTIIEHRRQVLPHIVLLRSLIGFYQLPVSCHELFAALVKVRQGRTPNTRDGLDENE